MNKEFTEENILKDLDLSDVSDLPKDLIGQINSIINKPINGIGARLNNVYQLFAIKQKLSVAEILVGLYRIHKINESKKWVFSALNNLKNKNLIRKVETGIYEKI